ncbi:MAG TPA: bifunctional (p)ppGpp synthetase/guanosine-3',5'-bis(diphosphate) 3'-pyrophosphohydrolase [Gemmatimonadota bacterium]|nr:bifunctional (p)ppGpp synthetase/guanosine-3',5'-bis(diphosphate) 3'-pyrophosphohydrolase [Gemmatimonadota bacterium]
MDKKRFCALLEPHSERLDLGLIGRAYAFGERAHDGQKRLSGEPFISHAAEIARILLDLNLIDTSTIAAALLHDVVEDTRTTVAELDGQFGAEVAGLVDGVTKIGHLKFRSREERQVENYRKLLLSMARDIRIIMIKLADRLHNMRTLEYLPEEKRRRIAGETRDIYAPLAHRFGMATIRWELEDLAFKFLEPDSYRELAKKVRAKRKERERMIAAIAGPLQEALKDADIKAEITGRPKHLWSIQKKMSSRTKPYEEIYDLLAIRALTETVRDCYHVLGLIHTLWTPVHERFKDYIATPKSNMYQSLHTTVFGPGATLYEIQIRTWEMHRTAEVGIAAHWKYKEGTAGTEVDEQLAWFRQILEWQQDMTDPQEFLEYLRIDLYKDEIFVFTPKGDVIQLPAGSTPIDFAFQVHTEVGVRCAGALVNGRMVPLHRELRSGETVEVLTNANQRPSRDWLHFVKTSKARSIIRRRIRADEHASSVALGKELLEKEYRRSRLRKPEDASLEAIAAHFGYDSIESFYAGLGRGDLTLTQVWNVLFPEEKPIERKPVSAFERLVERIKGRPGGVRIQGYDNMMVRFSQCCQPIPGDDIMGYVTRGRGVSVHRTDCPNILNLTQDPERKIDVQWDTSGAETFIVRLVVTGTDRRGLFADIAGAVSRTSTDIKSADLTATDNGIEGTFVVEVTDLDHLTRVIGAMKTIDGILEVERKEYVGSHQLAVESGGSETGRSEPGRVIGA